VGWTGLIWLRLGTSGGLLWTWWWTFGFHKCWEVLESLHNLRLLEKGSAPLSFFIQILRVLFTFCPYLQKKYFCYEILFKFLPCESIITVLTLCLQCTYAFWPETNRNNFLVAFQFPSPLFLNTYTDTQSHGETKWLTIVITVQGRTSLIFWDTMWSIESQPAFWRNISAPPSGFNSKPNKTPMWSKQQAKFCSEDGGALFLKMLVDFCRTFLHSGLSQNSCWCENLKFNKLKEDGTHETLKETQTKMQTNIMKYSRTSL
jgi:hypothetical protein